MKTNQILSPAASERFGNAPIASLQGSGLSFAGAYGSAKATAEAAAPAQHAMTLGTPNVVRTDDAQVPEPRGRQH